jgi:hypothetical protein
MPDPTIIAPDVIAAFNNNVNRHTRFYFRIATDWPWVEVTPWQASEIVPVIEEGEQLAAVEVQS